MQFFLTCETIFKILSNVSQTIVFVVQKCENLTHSLLTYFEKYAKIMHFLQFSKEIFLQIFENSPASGGGLRPPDPLRGRPKP